MPNLTLAESDFDEKFLENEIYLIPQKNTITAEIEKEEINKVYTYRMLHKKQAGRKYYDEILSTAPDALCPYCSLREADTIDHYLEKGKYPIYTVTPINLVPCCTLCNEDKKIPFPTSNTDQPLHPYYDKVDNVKWIKADVIQGNPVAVIYSASPPDEWDNILKERAINHFESFGLGELYSSNANRRLKGDRKRLKQLFNTNPSDLKSQLRECYESSLDLGINSFEAILFYTLYHDDWFCNIGVDY